MNPTTGESSILQVPRRQKIENNNLIWLDLHLQMMDRILHLLRYSQRIPLIQGGEGVGKSSLLAEMKHRYATYFKIQTLSVTQINTPLGLMSEICHVIGVDKPDYISDIHRWTTALIHHLEHVKGFRCWLFLIDDAHSLDESILTLLNELSSVQQRKSNSYIRFILAGSSAFAFDLKPFEYLFTIELPRLSQKQCVDFINLYHGRFVKQAKDSLNHDEVTLIAKQSGGNLKGLMDALTTHQSALSNKLTTEVKQAKRSFKFILPVTFFVRLKRLVLWMFLIFMAGLVAVLLFFQDQVNSLFSPSATTSSVQSYSESLEVIVNNQQDAAESVDEKTIVFASDILVDKSLVSEDELVNPIQNVTTEDESHLLVGAEHLTPVSISPINPVEPEMAAVAKVETRPLQNEIATPVNADALFLIDELNLLAKNPKHQILQLAAVNSMEDAIKLCEAHSIQLSDVSISRKVYKGKIVHVILYGDFESRDTALNFMKNMPDKFKSFQPWIKRLSVVQKEIREAISMLQKN